jgi:hypothetical protein
MFHLAGGLVGEGEGEYRVGGNAGADEVGDSAGDDAGFARARAGDDEQGAIDVADGGLLRIGEVGEKVFLRNH